MGVLDFFLNPAELLIDAILVIIEHINTWDANVTNLLTQDAGDYSESALILVRTLAENIVLPVATVIFAYVIVQDLVNILEAKNHMNDNTVQEVNKWIIKTFIGLLLISNAFTIAASIIQIGAYMVTRAIPHTASGDIVMSTIEAESALVDLSFWELIPLLFSLVVMWFINWIGTLVVMLFIVARYFEIYMYLMFAPLSLSTLLSNQLSTTGIGYIKNIVALALQGLIIVVAFSIYSAVSSTYVTNVISVDGFMDIIINPLSGFVQGAVLIIVLSITVWKSRSISINVVGV